MSDYISREAALTELQNPELFNVSPRFLQILRDLPAADVAEVRHVYRKVWGIDEYYGEWLRCPNCGYGDNVVDATYCGGCGAKIDLEGETNDD